MHAPERDPGAIIAVRLEQQIRIQETVMTDQPGASSEFVQCDFGSNWWSFVEGHLTDERIEQAKKSLTDFLGVEVRQRLGGLLDYYRRRAA